MSIPFVAHIEPRYGEAVRLSPLVRRVMAENPSEYTSLGTATYIVGTKDVAVIDPGPALDSHQQALERALQHDGVRAIVVTHCHADHSPLAGWLREASGAPTYAFGPHGVTTGAAGGLQETEAVDVGFTPDVFMTDGDVVAASGWSLEAVHTPGHTSNHLCYALPEEATLFTGDHVMGWSTTVVSPPDGDMAAYCESLRKLLGRPQDALYRPTHGGPVNDPRPFVEAYLAHRFEREAQILTLVRTGVGAIPDMVRVLYADLPDNLHRPASRSVLAHLIKLVDDGQVSVEGGGRPSAGATFGADG